AAKHRRARPAPGIARSLWRLRRRRRRAFRFATPVSVANLPGWVRIHCLGGRPCICSPPDSRGCMTTVARASTQAPLPEIAGYRLTGVLGEGGMSTVYLGTQLSLGREGALKLMRPEAVADEVSRRRCENEPRTIARLEHPHIVGIHEGGRTAEGLPWYSMPCLPRGHVGQRDLTGDPQRVREILRALLSALAFAHARGVVHRDVKAENVLFDEADRPLLA